MIRISRILSIPHYHEWVPLRNKVRTAAWVVAAGTMVPGFAVVGVADGAAASALGQVGVVLGGLVLAGLFRCGRYEIAVGTKRTDLGPDPFRRIVPTGAVESAACRPATSWRRLFADEEVVLQMSVGAGQVAVPSREPAALVAALDEIAGRDHSSTDEAHRVPPVRSFRLPIR